MLLSLENILAEFAALTGLSLEQAQRYVALCRTAASQIEALLRSPAHADGREESLELAAAGVAYYRFTLFGGRVLSVRIIGSLQRLIGFYGRPCAVDLGDRAVETHAFIEPLRYKNKMYLDGAFGKMGYNDPSHYLFICPPLPGGAKLTDDAEIICGDRRYSVKKAEQVYFKDNVFYCWAILKNVFGEMS